MFRNKNQIDTLLLKVITPQEAQKIILASGKLENVIVTSIDVPEYTKLSSLTLINCFIPHLNLHNVKIGKFRIRKSSIGVMTAPCGVKESKVAYSEIACITTTFKSKRDHIENAPGGYQFGLKTLIDPMYVEGFKVYVNIDDIK